jgi:hypothetical protein
LCHEYGQDLSAEMMSNAIKKFKLNNGTSLPINNEIPINDIPPDNNHDTTAMEEDNTAEDVLNSPFQMEDNSPYQREGNGPFIIEDSEEKNEEEGEEEQEEKEIETEEAMMEEVSNEQLHQIKG